MGEMKKEERGSWLIRAALGLFGLAIVTLVACSQKLGITDGTAAVMGWAIFLGGCAQLIAGLIDLRKNNAFGGTAFYRLRGCFGLPCIRLGDDQRHVRLLCGRNVRSAPNRSRFRGVPHLDCVYDHRSAAYHESAVLHIPRH